MAVVAWPGPSAVVSRQTSVVPCSAAPRCSEVIFEADSWCHLKSMTSPLMTLSYPDMPSTWHRYVTTFKNGHHGVSDRNHVQINKAITPTASVWGGGTTWRQTFSFLFFPFIVNWCADNALHGCQCCCCWCCDCSRHWRQLLGSDTLHLEGKNLLCWTWSAAKQSKRRNRCNNKTGHVSASESMLHRDGFSWHNLLR